MGGRRGGVCRKRRMRTVKEGHDRVEWRIDIYFFFMKKLGAGSVLGSQAYEGRIRGVARSKESILVLSRYIFFP
jgi:hypothetical protein